MRERRGIFQHIDWWVVILFLFLVILGQRKLLVELLHLSLKTFEKLLAKEMLGTKPVERAALDGFSQGFTLGAK